MEEELPVDLDDEPIIVSVTKAEGAVGGEAIKEEIHEDPQAPEILEVNSQAVFCLQSCK